MNKSFIGDFASEEAVEYNEHSIVGDKADQHITAVSHFSNAMINRRVFYRIYFTSVVSNEERPIDADLNIKNF